MKQANQQWCSPWPSQKPSTANVFLRLPGRRHPHDSGTFHFIWKWICRKFRSIWGKSWGKKHGFMMFHDVSCSKIPWINHFWRVSPRMKPHEFPAFSILEGIPNSQRNSEFTINNGTSPGILIGTVYTIWLNSSPWKDPPFFIYFDKWAIEKPWRSVNVITRPGNRDATIRIFVSEHGIFNLRLSGVFFGKTCREHVDSPTEGCSLLRQSHLDIMGPPLTKSLSWWT